MKNRIAITVTAIAALVITGCSKKVAQNIIDVPSPPINVVNENAGNGSHTAVDVANFYQADWSTFKSGGNAKLGGGGKSMNSSMQMRMHRGKSIYVSMRPIMGIEVAKMVISGDSILLVDKVHKRYVLEKASLLTNGVPVTVENLQDIFMGRAFELGKGSLTQSLKDDFTTEIKDGKVLLKPATQYNGFDYCFSYDSNCNIVSLDVHPTNGGSAATCGVVYDDIEGTVAGKVATSVKVSTVIGGKAFELLMEYKDVKFNEAFTIDTKTPTKYKRIEGKDIMTLFSVGK